MVAVLVKTVSTHVKNVNAIPENAVVSPIKRGCKFSTTHGPTLLDEFTLFCWITCPKKVDERS